MAEIDLFERRLAGAFLRLADDVAGTVDAAAVAHRVALEHPRRRARVLSWGNVAIPRPAWVLLLLAGLLVTLISGALLAGSQPQRRLPAVVPPVGQVYECPPGSNPDEPGPVDQARPPYAPAMAFDRRAGRLVALAQIDNGLQTWTFDVCTNTWTRMHPDREPPPGTGQLVYDVDSDVTIASDRTRTRMWAYDYEANTWTEKGVATAWLWAYDPVSGLVVAYGGPDPSLSLMTYDVETDTWTPIHKVNGARPDTGSFALDGWPLVLVYDASVDRIVTSVGAETWLFDIRTGRWSESSAEAPDVIDVFWTLPGIVYDEAAERTVLIGDVRLAAYDATADRWEILAETDPDRAAGFPVPSVYDPVNRRLIGWRRHATVDQGELFAFDLGTREWTVLLAASERQPSPP